MEILFENRIANINCRWCKNDFIIEEDDYEDGDEVDDICSLKCEENEKVQKKIDKGLVKCEMCMKYKKSLNDVTEYEPIYEGFGLKTENKHYYEKYKNMNKPYKLHKLYKIQHHKWCNNCKNKTPYIYEVNEKDNLQHIIKDDECIAVYVGYNYSEQIILRNKISNTKCLITNLSEN
jgi:hypothetical protein